LDSVVREIEHLQPDIVHFVNKHMWNYLLILRLKLRRSLTATSWIHTFHDPIGHEGDAIQRGVLVYHKLIQRLLDAVIVHSEIALRQALDVLRPKCPIMRVPLGVQPWHEPKPIGQSATKRLLVFGRLNRYKGIEMYPQIFAQIHQLDPQIQITVAGKPSEEIDDHLLNRIAACPNVNLEDRYLDEDKVEGYFEDSALVLAPYTSMTQSGVLLDAFSNSRPVLAFAIEGMTEFIPPNMPTVYPFDINSYAQLAVDMVNNPVACSKAGREAWEFGRLRFTPASMADGLMRVYQAVRRT
jgi:glycosyltransferase involved in cell wall biosynthesis